MVLNQNNYRGNDQGMTLIQLVVTVSIMLILIRISASSFVDFLIYRSINITTQNLEIQIDNLILKSRNEEGAVALCAGVDISCNTQNWSSGYISIYNEIDQNSQSNTKVLFQNDALKQGVKIISNAKKIVVLPSGFINIDAPINFLICSSLRPSHAVQLQLEPNGIMTQTAIEGPVTCDTI